MPVHVRVRVFSHACLREGNKEAKVELGDNKLKHESTQYFNCQFVLTQANENTFPDNSVLNWKRFPVQDRTRQNYPIYLLLFLSEYISQGKVHTTKIITNNLEILVAFLISTLQFMHLLCIYLFMYLLIHLF